jgi:hypothetical protein
MGLIPPSPYPSPAVKTCAHVEYHGRERELIDNVLREIQPMDPLSRHEKMTRERILTAGEGQGEGKTIQLFDYIA